MENILPAEVLFNKHAHTYQEKYMDVRGYGDSLDAFCAKITSPEAKILDIACGPGNITRYLLNKRPDFKILGIDLAENMIDLAKINNPEAEFAVMDCKEISRLNPDYAGVMCGFCLPYLNKTDALQLIEDASKLLLPGGVLYLSTMEDDYSKSGLKRSSTGDQTYMYFHEAGYLSDALLANGFEIYLLQRQPFPMSDGTENTDLLILAGK